MNGSGAGNVGARQMLHQPEIEGKILHLHAHLVERQDEASFFGLQIIVGIRDAFRDALEDTWFAEFIGGEEDFQLFERNVGINGHAQAANRTRGSLNSTSSRVTATSSTFRSKRALNALMTCATSNSGAEAPAET